MGGRGDAKDKTQHMGHFRGGGRQCGALHGQGLCLAGTKATWVGGRLFPIQYFPGKDVEGERLTW